MRKKMYESDVFQMKSEYHDFERGSSYELVHGVWSKVRYTTFTFAKITPEELNQISKYGNTRVAKVSPQYAPEIISARLYIYDKIVDNAMIRRHRLMQEEKEREE